ncbi:adenosine kinase [Actinoplanes tereljensis]|uniref:Adenosine kinase n=1 Tax=Paractinoplanes tereljensis TaxID=571912 RepID=A0A919NGN6_9ACTN|nr:carbohydrate kinase family protein [Actinoplanes tereljensis]GIF17774.1 adenosine kinase [Actinoplanes tereljensis]
MILVSGSIATDHLMTFPGSFAEQILPESLSAISLSFLADELTVHRGGVAANIAYGIARLGGRTVLVGAVGADFDVEYRGWLEASGVDCAGVLTSATAHTARFVCTTDRELCQIATFYPGAMSESESIDLAPIGDRHRPTLVLIGPDMPGAMLRHAAVCRDRGWRFAADPSQQLATMTAAEVREFITGAAYLFTNEYEYDLLLDRTDLSDRQLTELVGLAVTTLGAKGVRLTDRLGTSTVPAVPVDRVIDPTGSGDAFRAGFLIGTARGLSPFAAAELGCQVATLCLAQPGTQTYDPRGLGGPDHV